MSACVGTLRIWLGPYHPCDMYHTMDERTRPSVQAAIEAAAVCDDRLRHFALHFVGSNDCGTAAGTWASTRKR